MLLIAAGLFAATFGPEFAEGTVGHTFGPAFYPRIVLAVWIALCLILIVRGIGRRASVFVPPQAWGPVGAYAVLTGLYIWLIGVIGFLFASILLSLGGMLGLDERRPLLLLLAGVLFPVLIWCVFTFGIGIPLPSSPWFDRV